MAEIKLPAQRRAGTGKGGARKVRAAGRVPAVVYGRGMESTPIDVDRRDLVSALLTDAGMNVLLDIELDGDNVLALTRELQRDPVKGTLLHADFVKVDRSREIDVDVPAHLTGSAPGVSEGGVLEQPLHALGVRCRPGDVPEAIEVDISSLGIGDSLRVGDLPAGLDYTITSDPETVIVHIAPPITEEALEAMVAATVPEAAPAEAEAEPAPEEAAEPAGEGADKGTAAAE